MGVRIQLEIGYGKRRLSSPALLNGGFETDEPCILLPERSAEALCHRIPGSWVSKEVFTAGGPSRVRVMPSRLRIRVWAKDRAGPWTQVRAIVSGEEREILVSDRAIDLLGVEIKSHGAGLWRFLGERRTRQSVSPREW